MTSRRRSPAIWRRAAPLAVLAFALAAAPALGGEAHQVPELRLFRPDGTKADVAYASAPLSLVNFWATWCAPCRGEMPEIDRIYRKYKDRGLQVIGIAVMSGEPSEVKSFLDNQPVKVSYPILMGNLEVMKAFGEAEILPTTYLIGPDARVVARHVGVTPDFAETITAEIDARLGGHEKAPGGKHAANGKNGGGDPPRLTAADKKIVDALLADWSLPNHLSSVDLIMRNIGVRPTAEERIRLGKYIEGDVGLHPALKAYGTTSVVLSSEEKLALLALMTRRKAGDPVPTLQELSGLTGAGLSELQSSFEVMESLGFVEPVPGTGGVGMRVPESVAGSFLPIDLAGTIVNEPSRKPFAVASLARYLEAAAASPPAGKVVIDGLCAHCASRIRIVIEDGRVSLPTSAALLMEGADDVLFVSPAHLGSWLKGHPDLEGARRVKVEDFVRSIHDQPPAVPGSSPPPAAGTVRSL